MICVKTLEAPVECPARYWCGVVLERAMPKVVLEEVEGLFDELHPTIKSALGE